MGPTYLGVEGLVRCSSPFLSPPFSPFSITFPNAPHQKDPRVRGVASCRQRERESADVREMRNVAERETNAWCRRTIEKWDLGRQGALWRSVWEGEEPEHFRAFLSPNRFLLLLFLFSSFWQALKSFHSLGPPQRRMDFHVGSVPKSSYGVSLHRLIDVQIYSVSTKNP